MNAVSAALDEAYSAGAGAAAVVPGDRHHVDDRAAPALDHRGGHRLRGQHGALEVERDDLVEARLGELEDPEPRDERPGVVDENIDRSEIGDRAIDDRTDVVRAPHVGLDGNGRASSRHNPIARVFGAFPVAMVGERDLRPEIGKSDGRRRADARRCASDERDSAGEIEIAVHVGEFRSGAPAARARREGAARERWGWGPAALINADTAVPQAGCGP